MEPQKFENLTLEVEFCQPNPDLLELLAGGAPEKAYAIEMMCPVKRTFWQWLFRKPRQYRGYYVPNAQVIDVSGPGL